MFIRDGPPKYDAEWRERRRETGKEEKICFGLHHAKVKSMPMTLIQTERN